MIWPLDGPFKPSIEAGDADASNYYRSFFSLYGPSFGTSLKSDYDLFIDQKMWFAGFCFWKINMSRTSSDVSIQGESFLDQRTATSGLDLHVTFKTPLTQATTCVIFTSYIETLSISADSQGVRHVELDYSL